MHATLIDPRDMARIKDTFTSAGDFYAVIDHEQKRIIATLWKDARGYICEILNHGRRPCDRNTNAAPEFQDALMPSWYAGLAHHLGASRLWINGHLYEDISAHVRTPDAIWDQWDPRQVAKHDVSGLIFRKDTSTPGLTRYTAVEDELPVLDGLEHFVNTGVINDDLYKLLVRHGQAPNLRYYPLSLVLRGNDTGRGTSPERRRAGQSRPPMTWLRSKRRTVLDLIPQPQ